MDELEELVLIEKAALAISQEYREALQQLERENDKILGELRQAKAQVRHLLAERVAELRPRPRNHQHSTDELTPVLVFDLDGTLHPYDGYPINNEPYPGVKEALDRFAGQGCCLHLATAGLFYSGPQDLEVFYARLALMDGWVKQYALPIELLLPKCPADEYYDDRMVECDAANPDWGAYAEEAEARLALRFDLKNGQWVRKPRPPRGRMITDFPENDPGDKPRGNSGPRLDIDLHRTISEASSSERDAKPRPGAKEVITRLYDDGVLINVSCGGWNPVTHTAEQTAERVRGERHWLREHGIPYDRLVAKDHGDLFFDDKGVRHLDWLKDEPRIVAKLKKEAPSQYRHDPPQ